MGLTSIVVVCFALGQAMPADGDAPEGVASPATESGAALEEMETSAPVDPQGDDVLESQALPLGRNGATGGTPEAGGGAMDVSPADGQGDQRPTPLSLYRRLLLLDENSPLAGRTLGLGDALSKVSLPKERLALLKAYWSASRALAEYSTTLDLALTWQEVVDVQSTDSLGATVQSTLLGRLDAEEIALQEAQFALASAARLPVGQDNPVPSQVPHMRAYVTKYKEIRSTTVLSERAALIAETIPLRYEAVHARFNAAEAAQLLVIDMRDAFEQGNASLDALLVALEDWGKSRLAFIEAVYRYNVAIAEYAMEIVGPDVKGRQLLETLIDLDTVEQMTPEPAGADGAAYEDAPSADGGRYDIPEVGSIYDAPSRATDREDRAVAGAPTEYQTRRPIVERAEGIVSPADLLFSEIDVEPRVKWPEALVAQLCDHVRPQALPGQDASLLACLRQVQGVRDRTAVIAAYWDAQAAAGEAHVQRARMALIEQLVATLRDAAEQPGVALAMLTLHARKAEVEGDLIEAQLGWLESQWKLTQLAGFPLDGDWILPTTLPHAGPYELNWDAQPPEVTQLRRVQRLVARAPQLWDQLQGRAKAMVESDAVRAHRAADWLAGDSSSWEQTLIALRQWTIQSRQFLRTLSAYNLCMGEYALAVLPSDVAAEDLARSLVLP